MTQGVGNINRLVPGLIEQSSKTVKLDPTNSPETKEAGFTEIFSNMLNSVDAIQKDSAQMQEAFMNGEPVELHQMMIKAQEAGISMDLLLEVRNKLVNAYSEIMRMPI